MYSPDEDRVKRKPNNLSKYKSGVPKFVGREEALKQLDKQLKESRRVAISALTGMGGIGKTELALQYALTYIDKDLQDCSYKSGICWVNVSDQSNVGTQILNFAQDYLKIDILEERELEERVQHCWQDWGEEDSLIIFDDVRDYEQIYDFLPPQEKRFKVIITTRKKRLADSIKVFALEVLDEKSSLDLIISFISQERVHQELDEAKLLCQDLGYLPLGLELVSKFLKRYPNRSINKYRETLKKSGLETKGMKEVTTEMTAERGVKAAFDISWEELDEEAKEMAYYLSLFEVAPIPYQLIKELCPIEDEDDLEYLLEDSLINFSLIKDLGNQVYEIHTLIHQYLREKLEQSILTNEVKKAYCQLMVSVTKEIPEKPVKTDIEKLTPIIPHLKVVAKELNEFINDEELLWPYVVIGRFYTTQALYKEAEPFYQKCLDSSKQRFGEEHSDVATSFNNLAELYNVQRKYEEAEPLYLQSLELRKKLLGENHPYVVSSLNNLAELYRTQGKYKQAETLGLQSLELSKKLLEEDHPYVATTFNNLALLYHTQGKYEEAEPLYLQSIKLGKKLLGEDHPYVLTSLNNLAEVYRVQRKYEEAENLYLQSLELRKKLLGENHLDVANSLYNLGVLYIDQEKYEEAEPLLIKACELCKKLLGEDNYYVALILRNLAQLYHKQKKYEEAEPLLIQSIKVHKQILGEDHHDLSNSFNKLALLYSEQGRYKEAEPLYIKAIELFKILLGENHPNTKRVKENYELMKREMK